jgi:hypothetical protein
MNSLQPLKFNSAPSQRLVGLYRVSQEESSIFWEVVVSVILRKNIYMNMCPIPNDFRYLARNIFLPSLSVSNHNSQLTLHTDSHASDIGALRREGRKILCAKFKITSRQITETVRFVHITFSQTDRYYDLPHLSSWNIEYISRGLTQTYTCEIWKYIF